MHAEETDQTAEYIEYTHPRRYEYLDPRAPGSPLPPDVPREDRGWMGLNVPTAMANVCRELSRRGKHGVHVDAIGGPDTLAELDLHGLPYKVVGFARRGEFDKAVWVVPDAVYRFAEDREGDA